VPAVNGPASVYAGTGQTASGTEVAFPLQVTPHGRVATATWEQHVEQMIEQVLFTAPGERVNRPDFGCGLLQLVFGPNSSEIAAAAQFTIGAALQQWLGDLVQVQEVRVLSEDAVLRITIEYIVILTQQRRTAQFSQGVSA
jgi:phage baseplate assembly protein W